jgi:PPOX class probable F420-dependent enzyme
MELHPELKDAIDNGVHGHLVTVDADGAPQVSMIWLGRDGDELLVAHLGGGAKIRNLERDPRVAVSFEVEGKAGPNLNRYAVVHGRARITDGGAPQLLQALAPRFLGDGVDFLDVDNSPPGHIVHISIERVTGAGPWGGQWANA